MVEAGKKRQEHRSGRGSRRKKSTQKHASRPLTPRQERLAQQMVSTPPPPSLAEAGRQAGYRESTVRGDSWYHRYHEKIRPRTIGELARKGLTLPFAAGKHFELLNAKKIQVVGENCTTLEVPNSEVQLKALEHYYRILGPGGKVAGDMPEEGEMGNRIIVNIHHAQAPVKVQAATLRVTVPSRTDGR